MNRLIFMVHFDESDLEDINNFMRKRYGAHVPHDYMAEIYEGVLTVTLGFTEFCGETITISIEDFGLLLESDNFYLMYDVAKILAENYDEDFDIREMFEDARDSCKEDCDSCGICP